MELYEQFGLVSATRAMIFDCLTVTTYMYQYTQDTAYTCNSACTYMCLSRNYLTHGNFNLCRLRDGAIVGDNGICLWKLFLLSQVVGSNPRFTLCSGQQLHV